MRPLDDDGRNLVLAECDVGFQSALPADEVVAGVAVRPVGQRHRDRLLQPQLGDVGRRSARTSSCRGARGFSTLICLIGNHATSGVVSNVHAATSIFRACGQVGEVVQVVELVGVQVRAVGLAQQQPRRLDVHDRQQVVVGRLAVGRVHAHQDRDVGREPLVDLNQPAQRAGRRLPAPGQHHRRRCTRR